MFFVSQAYYEVVQGYYGVYGLFNPGNLVLDIDNKWGTWLYCLTIMII